MTGESKQIAERVAEWIKQHNLNTFQGGIVYEGKSAKGAHYWAVDMGTPRTMDGTIQIYNKNFIVTNISTLGRASFKNEDSLMEYLNQGFKNE